MKLLLFAKKFYSKEYVSGGMENYLYNLVVRLKKNHDITVFLPSRYNFQLEGVKVYHFFEIQIPILCLISTAISILITLPKILYKEKIQLISAFIPSFESFIVFFIAKLFRIKTAINIRGIWLKNEYFMILLAGLTFLVSDAIITNSKKLLNKYSEILYIPKSVFHRINSFYVPNAIDIQLWKPDDHPQLKEFDIVYIANLHSTVRVKKKGFAVLYEALEIIKQRHNISLKVEIIGDFNKRAVEKTIGKFNDEFFTIHGLILEKNQLKRLIRSAKIFVLSSNIEGMPNCLIESMALAMPCISTDVGSVNKIINDNIDGIIVPKGNSQVLADKIYFLLSNDELQAKFSLKARETIVNNFNWEKNLKIIQKLYQMIINRNL